MCRQIRRAQGSFVWIRAANRRTLRAVRARKKVIITVGWAAVAGVSPVAADVQISIHTLGQRRGTDLFVVLRNGLHQRFPVLSALWSGGRVARADGWGMSEYHWHDLALTECPRFRWHVRAACSMQEWTSQTRYTPISRHSFCHCSLHCSSALRTVASAALGSSLCFTVACHLRRRPFLTASTEVIFRRPDSAAIGGNADSHWQGFLVQPRIIRCTQVHKVPCY